MSRTPLVKYLTSKIQNLKVYEIKAVLSSTPLEINLDVFTERFGYNSLYDRFRFWTTMEALEETVKMEEDMRLSEHISPRLIIRRMNVEEDYLIFCAIWFEGSIEIHCNDSEVARRFHDDVLTSKINPPTIERLPPQKVTCRWTTDTATLARYQGCMIGSLSWFFSEGGNKRRFKELHSRYRKSLTRDLGD